MAEEKTIAPYGTWESPITSELLARNSLKFNEVHVNQIDGSIYLIEGRPSEKGRCAIVRVSESESIDILPQGFSVKSKVHEYGGGAAAMGPDGWLVFTDGNTNSVYFLSPSGECTRIIEGDTNMRFGNFHVNPGDPNLILAVLENHQDSEVINKIVVINAQEMPAKVIVVAEGADFYSDPKFSPDATYLSWIQWNHPDMPWTGSELYIAVWDQGFTLGHRIKIAGQARKESVCEPKWHLDGSLLFCNDSTGFSQLYRFDITTQIVEQVIISGFEDVELGCGTDSKIGRCTYASITEDQLVLSYTRNAVSGIILYDMAAKFASELEVGLVNIQGNALRRVSNTQFAVIGVSLTGPTALYLVDIHNPSQKKMLKSSSNMELPPSILSHAKTITFPRANGDIPQSNSHAIFIPPQNPSFCAPFGTKPPLIIRIHGGPTSHASPGLSLQAQYFTSRGYAYCYPNYAGSTGYGRSYRQSLNYYWGIKDCEDTVSCVQYLSSEGLIDGTKVGIIGGSSGGYTVLQSMCTFPEVFAAGCSLYGIGNLRAIAVDTAKFESHYLFDLIFPEGTLKERQEQIYDERSPCLHVGKIERPLLLLQGEIDHVVPLAQALEMEQSLKKKKQGADVKLIVFEGEGHGFVMKENIKRAIEEEEALWRRTLLV